LKILTLPHAFRFVGLSFLFAGPALPTELAEPAAYGDLVAAILALAAFAALARRWPGDVPLTWVLNIWGTADLLFAYYNGVSRNLDASQLGPVYYIPTIVVPMLLVVHAMTFVVLTRRGKQAPAPVT